MLLGVQRQTLSLLLMAFFIGCDSAAPSDVTILINHPAQGTENREMDTQYAEYIPGTLPILLIAAHDGDLRPADIAPRENTSGLARLSTANDCRREFFCGCRS